MKRRLLLLSALVLMSVGLCAQTLVFHHCGGGETAVQLPATWSLQDGKIVVSGGGEQVEIQKSEVLTVSYRGAAGDVNGDERVDIGDVATIIGLIGNGGGGSGTDHAPAGVEAVDLGLPSGTKWANMNVGAEKPEDYGFYFAWGETTGYTTDTSDGRSFDWASYKLCNGSYNTMTKYCTSSTCGTVDNKTVLGLEDDAAHANWGGDWRMPTIEDFQELLANTTSEWITVVGVSGYRFKSKKANADGTYNSIFFPAAGGRYDASLGNQSTGGYYWSSSLDTSGSYSARVLDFSSGGADTNSGSSRRRGQSVRAVLKN